MKLPRTWFWSSYTGVMLFVVVLLSGLVARLGFTEEAAIAFEAYALVLLLAGLQLKRRIFLSGVVFLYVILQLAMAAANGDVHWEDFVRGVKPWIYLALFLSCYGARVACTKHFVWVLYVFAVAYVITLAMGDDRPRLLVENNFEIPFFVLIYAALVMQGRVELVGFVSVLVALTVMMSMSRSGIVAYLIVVGMLFVRRVRAGRGSGYLSWRALVQYAWLVPIALVGIALIFSSRTTDFEHIDRVAFFRTYAATMMDFEWLQWLFGAGSLTELPVHACLEHAFYLQALAGKFGQCYSVVWHASFMRLSHDFGVLGLCVLYMGFYLVLRSRYSRYDALIGLAPSVLAGFSVGGIYNYFSMLGILVYFALAPKEFANLNRQTNLSSSS